MTHKSRSCKEEKNYEFLGREDSNLRPSFFAVRCSATDLQRTSRCARSIAIVYMISVQLSSGISRVYSVMA